ncbi:MAG TPA: hypothetical protein VJL28_02090 [Gemmatimonadaceae bacterium]|nr:hypothetical protein [Gemmatimonadaceae bacterium]
MSPWAYVGIAVGVLVGGSVLRMVLRPRKSLREENPYATKVCTKAGVLDAGCWENVNECDQFGRGTRDFKKCVKDAKELTR